MKIAVFDTETTGLNPDRNRIIELSILFLEEYKITDRLNILFNPGTRIPSIITNLTGIDNNLVLGATSFEEVAEQILCLLDGFIICGHNVSFDYAFLKMEFQRCGYSFNKELLDTVHLSKLLFPGRNSYSLKSLCKHFTIINKRPHRAYYDALATAELLIKLKQYAGNSLFEKIITPERLNKLTVVIDKSKIKKLPQLTGVYYFLNNRNKPVYIGKAKNIRSRIISHIRGDGNSVKIMAASDEIKDLKYTVTGSEILALLLEDHEIRHFWPSLNNSQKSFNKRFGIAVFKDQLNRWRMAICTSGKAHCFIAWYHSYYKAVDFVLDKINEYGLNGNYCSQPMKSEIDDVVHNQAFELMVDHLYNYSKIEIFLTDGRKEGEVGFIWIENDMYKGFGYALKDELLNIHKLKPLLQVRYSSITVEKTLQNLRRRKQPDIVFSEMKKAPTEENTVEA